MARSSLQDELIQVARRVEMGLPINRDKYNVSNGICFYARKNIASATVATVNFFGTATNYAAPETNWPSAQGLPIDQVFIWEYVSFKLDANNDLANAAVANSEFASESTSKAGTNAEQYKNLMEVGDIRGFIGTRQVLAGHGPCTFPAGHGVDVQGNVIAASAAACSMASLNNGESNLRNRYPLDPAQYILGQERVQVLWDVPSRTLTAVPTVKCCMWGTLIRASNR